MKKNFLYYLFLIFFLSTSIVGSLAFAREEVLPDSGSDIVGNPQVVTVEVSENCSDIALRYDVGFFELYETNFGIDCNNLIEGAKLIIPTQYILPKELRENLVLINLAELRLYYIPKKSRKVYIFPVGIGKVDWATPTGQMRIVKKIKNPTWVIPKSIRKYRTFRGEILPQVVPAGAENPLGSYALRLSYKDYLIHGTNLPFGVGRRSSAGCIRLYERDIEQLFELVEEGTPVLIINQPYKAGFLDSKLYLEAHLPLFEQRIERASGDMMPAIEILEEANKAHRVHIDWKKAFKIVTEHLNVPRRVA